MLYPLLSVLSGRLKQSILVVSEDADPTMTIKTKDLGLILNPESSLVIKSSELFSLPDSRGRPFNFILEIKAEMHVREMLGSSASYSSWTPYDEPSDNVGLLVCIEWNPQISHVKNDGKMLEHFREEAIKLGFDGNIFARKIEFFPYLCQNELVNWVERYLRSASGFVFAAKTLGLL